MRTIENLKKEEIENFYKVIGQNVKRLRKSKGLSQLDLSHAIGHKSVSLVSHAEIYYKEQHFNIEHLYKIAYILEYPIEEFFKEN